MKETRLWRQLAPQLARYGKFQKISDRFTGGVSDVLGSQRPTGRACAFELKEFYMKSGRLHADFRPGQIPFLAEWGEAGGLALVVGTLDKQVAAFSWRAAQRLSDGMEVRMRAIPRQKQDLGCALVVEPTGAWRPFVERLMALPGG